MGCDAGDAGAGDCEGEEGEGGALGGEGEEPEADWVSGGVVQAKWRLRGAGRVGPGRGAGTGCEGV